MREDRLSRAGDETGRFSADVATVTATVEDAPEAFLEEPATAADYHYPFISAEESLTLGRFDGVPGDVDPNHAAEVALGFE